MDDAQVTVHDSIRIDVDCLDDDLRQTVERIASNPAFIYRDEITHTLLVQLIRSVQSLERTIIEAKTIR